MIQEDQLTVHTSLEGKNASVIEQLINEESQYYLIMISLIQTLLCTLQLSINSRGLATHKTRVYLQLLSEYFYTMLSFYYIWTTVQWSSTPAIYIILNERLE